MAVSAGEQRGNGQTDEERAPNALRCQKIPQERIPLGQSLPPGMYRRVIMDTLHAAVSEKINFDIVKIPAHKPVEFPLGIGPPQRMGDIKGNGAIHSGQ